MDSDVGTVEGDEAEVGETTREVGAMILVVSLLYSIGWSLASKVGIWCSECVNEGQRIDLHRVGDHISGNGMD